MLTARLPLRGVDAYGSGAYQAPRGLHRHHGIDYACLPGSEILSPVNGKVTKLGWPYSQSNFRYVEVTYSDKSYRARFFYIEPLVKVGDQINKGDPLGISQDLSTRFVKTSNGGMVNHIHTEVMHGPNPPACYVHPTDWMFNERADAI